MVILLLICENKFNFQSVLTGIAVILVLLRCCLFTSWGYIQVNAPYLFN